MNGNSSHGRSLDVTMEALERRATTVRSRLLRAIDALDVRRQQVTQLGARAKQMARPIGISLLGLAVLLGAGVVLLGVALRSRRRPLKSRFRGVIQQWGLMRPATPSLGRRILERLALTLASALAAELGKRVSKNVIDGRLPDGRLAIGRALALRRNPGSSPVGAR